jgi:N6-adenosine-specific RNA methylase IME4
LCKAKDAKEIICGSGVWRPAPTCHLYFWVTNNYLPYGLAIVKELGFDYKTIITWAKPTFGIGQYFRGQTEHMLFAVRGKGLALRRQHTDWRGSSTLLHADRPRDERGKPIHSAKPNKSYELMEKCSPGPRLEMFARRLREGWTSWGDEM